MAVLAAAVGGLCFLLGRRSAHTFVPTANASAGDVEVSFLSKATLAFGHAHSCSVYCDSVQSGCLYCNSLGWQRRGESLPLLSIIVCRQGCWVATSSLSSGRTLQAEARSWLLASKTCSLVALGAYCCSCPSRSASKVAGWQRRCKAATELCQWHQATGCRQLAAKSHRHLQARWDEP